MRLLNLDLHKTSNYEKKREQKVRKISLGKTLQPFSTLCVFIPCVYSLWWRFLPCALILCCALKLDTIHTCIIIRVYTGNTIYGVQIIESQSPAVYTIQYYTYLHCIGSNCLSCHKKNLLCIQKRTFGS